RVRRSSRLVFVSSSRAVPVVKAAACSQLQRCRVHQPQAVILKRSDKDRFRISTKTPPQLTRILSAVNNQPSAPTSPPIPAPKHSGTSPDDCDPAKPTATSSPSRCTQVSP